MDGVGHIVGLWAEEGLVVLAMFTGLVLFHYATKLWGAPADVLLGVILGVCVGVAGAGLYLTRHVWGIALSARAFWFIALYLWCVIVMLFFAARKTHRFKLFLGLASQAGIVYALFVLL
jgi:hypothetical protein